MKALLERLGNPERQVQAIHVVGTNGKSTTTRMIEALLLAEGVLAGAYVSPHVVRWSERIRVGGEGGGPGGTLARGGAPAGSFFGFAVDSGPARAVALPGRLEVVGEEPLELWDGAHNADGGRWLPPELPPRGFAF